MKKFKFVETEPKQITLEFKTKSGKKVKFNAVEVVKTKNEIALKNWAFDVRK